MAEDFDQSKTEAPTQRRREEAREEGQVAVSAELTAGVLLLTGMLALQTGGRRLLSSLLGVLDLSLLSMNAKNFGPDEAQAAIVAQMTLAAQWLGFFLGVLFVSALGVGALQVGLHVVPTLVLPRWEKISPAEGWSRLFSTAAAMRGLIAVFKVAVVAAMAVWVLRGRVVEIITLGQSSVSSSAVQAWDIAIRLALAIAAALLVLGVIDYLFQRWRYEQSLRMSRQELKEELRREEGDPLMRGRIRKMQREAARKRMMQEVPRATVVITNPTRLAIALRYERGTMAAPRVIAKGAGFVALNIIELARRHGVPVVERKEVAQALFKAVQIGQDIPAALYYAVAEVLAYLYRLRGAVPS